jgi:hypothetical protein
MSAVKQLENSLEGVFVKSAPKLPENAKKMLVEWLPWINLVIGLLTLAAVYSLWHWAHVANSLINYANELSVSLGGDKVVSSRMSVGIWLAIVVLAVEAVLLLTAFKATLDRKKNGWDLMFYVALLNIAYGLVLVFTDYGTVGNFLWSLLGSAIGLYFLFQIKDKYLARKKS